MNIPENSTKQTTHQQFELRKNERHGAKIFNSIQIYLKTQMTFSGKKNIYTSNDPDRARSLTKPIMIEELETVFPSKTL